MNGTIEIKFGLRRTSVLYLSWVSIRIEEYHLHWIRKLK